MPGLEPRDPNEARGRSNIPQTHIFLEGGTSISSASQAAMNLRRADAAQVELIVGDEGDLVQR